MTDFAETWVLVRGRFEQAIEGLSQEQLNWRLHDKALTLGETALHVAGVETSFIAQLKGDVLEGITSKVALAATNGVVNSEPFPFAAEEITPEFVKERLQIARQYTDPIISNPSKEILERKIKSALGPVIDGRGAFARLAYHPGYHQGQAHLIANAPGFPAS